MELLSTFIVWLIPAICSRDITIYLVLSPFTSSLVSLVAITRASAFSFTVCTPLPNKKKSVYVQRNCEKEWAEKVWRVWRNVWLVLFPSGPHPRIICTTMPAFVQAPLSNQQFNADFSSCLYAPFTTTKVNACEGNTNPLQQIKSHHFLRVTSADHHHNIIACPMATRRQVPCVCAAVGFKESSERTVCLSVISTHQVR